MNLKAVYIHLGNPIPNYLLNNLKRHSKLFPQISTTLILSSDKYVPSELIGIDFYIYTNSFSGILSKYSNLKLRSRFRNNFWLLSLERLLVLSEFHNKNPESKILHIESDVLLLPNFPWEKFNDLKTLFWSSYEPHRDVAALLFSPSAKESQWLNDNILQLCKLNNEHTDMTVLSELHKNHPNKIQLLPTFSNKFPEMFNNNSDPTGENRFSCSSHFNKFDGVFDPAAIGVWLCGTDPRNHYGFSKIHLSQILENGKNFIDPSQISYEISKEGNLFMINELARIPIYNLHIHSKNADLLGDQWQNNLEYFIEKSAQKNETLVFSLFSLIQEIQMNFKQRTFLRYFLSIPSIYKFYKKLKYLYFKYLLRQPHSV